VTTPRTHFRKRSSTAPCRTGSTATGIVGIFPDPVRATTCTPFAPRWACRSTKAAFRWSSC
jgi:hypothetical protein